MLLIDHSLATPQANLAFDEAIIESVEPSQFAAAEQNAPPLEQDLESSADRSSLESLRLWEMPSLCVVMGRGSKAAEVNLAACEADRIPVLRRCSGGASIVAGPGCLMYSLLLSLEHRPALRSIDRSHGWVMQHLAAAVASVVPDVSLQGTCDLTWRGRKVSGNAVRYKRDWLLYHGTLLYQFPLDAISRYLALPPRQPAYRESRSHRDFLANLACDPALLRHALAATWHAEQAWYSHPQAAAISTMSQRILETKFA